MAFQIVLSVGVFLIAGMMFYAMSLYNGLVTVRNNVGKAWSNIDVLLKQRHDELPKLISVCERYMRHERETLESVTRARAMINDARSMDEKGKAEGFLKDALKSLFAVSENYPELKADERFGQLQSRITELENEISDRREFYNESVNIYNIRIEKVPDLILAEWMRLVPKEMWKAPRKELTDVAVSFSEYNTG